VPTPHWEPAALAVAFAEFEPASQVLASSHAGLEARVAELTAALNRSHAALAAELANKARLTARLGALRDALPAGVIVLDGSGRVAECNPAAVELLGTLAIGDAWVEVVARAFAPRWDDGHDISLVDGRRVNVATAALAHDPGQILLLTDVSETRKLQEQLNHMRRLAAKTELAAVLAHQVRTPLATALLQLGNLGRAGFSEAARERARSRAAESIRAIERLVNDMLSFARGSVVDPAPVAVHALLADVARAARAGDGDEGFVLDVDCTDTALTVWGNRDALVSILSNLVDNAHKAMPAGGYCHLSAGALADQIVIRVSDSGAGVPNALRGQIFEPFFTTRPQGTGLGLAVARAVARAHGGDLQLDPSVMVGASFVMCLPAAVSETTARQRLIPGSIDHHD
jgi:two-component system sensor histidine kinase FlrB